MICKLNTCTLSKKFKLHYLLVLLLLTVLFLCIPCSSTRVKIYSLCVSYENDLIFNREWMNRWHTFSFVQRLFLPARQKSTWNWPTHPWASTGSLWFYDTLTATKYWSRSFLLNTLSKTKPLILYPQTRQCACVTFSYGGL